MVHFLNIRQIGGTKTEIIKTYLDEKELETRRKNRKYGIIWIQPD